MWLIFSKLGCCSKARACITLMLVFLEHIWVQGVPNLAMTDREQEAETPLALLIWSLPLGLRGLFWSGLGTLAEAPRLQEPSILRGNSEVEEQHYSWQW